MSKLGPLATVGGAVTIAIVANISVAAPVSQGAGATIKAAATLNLVEQAHGTHRACLRGPVARWGGIVRWHRHVGVAHVPVGC